MAKALRDAKAKAPKVDDKSEDQAQALAGNEGDAPVAQDANGGEAQSLTTSANNPPVSEDQGGAGNPAGSAESFTLEGLSDLEKRLGKAEAEFRSKYPLMAAAIDAWQAKNSGEVPNGLRIVSKVDGFRRGGIAHSKMPVEHLMEAFQGPEQIEALFAEPNLVVGFI
ncbi:HI1506-related protein [Mesorhizobium sp. ES1-1]|uniref:HI1506-related protein n=1 Tax=Mesorhizobium sp. ES1-1 TaxID=2876629 RepID=UPI001CCCEA4D|nr:HI1506-related protein [Mesorhizobium sp. ES1-1]MBZ9678899.1 hypothetical protein [Mesorhizobium sp. ES1-1]